MTRNAYPANWKVMRAAVLARAQYRCEGCPRYPDCRADNGKPHPVTGSLVWLTTAHKHGTSTMSQDLGDLMALCQRCHLAYDQEMHQLHARETRERRRGARSGRAPARAPRTSGTTWTGRVARFGLLCMAPDAWYVKDRLHPDTTLKGPRFHSREAAEQERRRLNRAEARAPSPYRRLITPEPFGKATN